MSQSPKRLAVAVASLVLLAFVVGASVGVVGDWLVSPDVRIRTTFGDMSSVLDRLDLTPEQRRRADSIVLRSEPRAREVLTELGERLRRVADSVDAELRSILTPDQRLRLDSMRTEPRFMLKRKSSTGSGEKIDTILDSEPRIRRR